MFPFGGGAEDEEERLKEVEERGGMERRNISLMRDVMGMARMANILRIAP
jgi:hypothetical protein